jgi:hypothetical protein
MKIAARRDFLIGGAAVSIAGGVAWAKLEETFGVYDLAQFTPPTPT